jgi:hypothetical protein
MLNRPIVELARNDDLAALVDMRPAHQELAALRLEVGPAGRAGVSIGKDFVEFL